MAEETDVTAVADAPETEADATEQVEQLEEKVDPKEHLKLKEQLKKVNRESAERRVKLEALEKEKADKDKADLSELDRAKLELSETQQKHAAQEAELKTMRRERSFEQAERKLSLTWFNETARNDAIKILEAVEPENMEKELKKLAGERPNWLKNAEVPDIDSQNNGKQTGLTDAKKRELATRYNIK